MATKNYDNFDFDEYQKNRNQNSENGNGSKYDNYDFDDVYIRQNLPQVGEYLTSSINSWLKKNESFVNSYNSRYSGENTSYRSDASDWLSSVTTQKENLEKEASEIKTWLEQYKDYLDEDYYSSVIKALDGNIKVYGDILSNSTKDNEFWSQFASEDDYIKWSAEWLDTDGTTSAEKVAQRQDIYQRNKDRIAEIEKVTGTNGFSEFFGGIAAEWNAVWQGDESIKYDYYDLIEEKEALEAENKLYESTQGKMDSHYMPITDEVTQIASNRDFGNPTRDELAEYDSSVSQGSLALNNGGYYDDDGNIRDKDGKIVQYAESPVTDKLGMYLSASDKDLAEAYNLYGGAMGNYATTWAELLVEGDTNAWKELSEDEITIYYYKLNTEGQESAYKFLEDMTVELSRRATEKMEGEINQAPVYAQILLNAASIPMNVFGGAVGLLGDVADAMEGKDYNPYSASHSLSNASSAIRQDTASDINKATGNMALPWVGTTFGDVYQSIMSAGDSVLASTIPGGHVLLGLNAASTEMKNLYERGASTEQMLAGGILAGAAESFFEKYSIGELNKIKSMDKKAVKNFVDGFVRAVVMGGVEASEEMATEIANTISDALIMGTQSDWKDFETFAKNVVNAGIGGLISGGLMGGVASAVNHAQFNKQTNIQGQAIIDNGGVDALKKLAFDVYSNKSGLDAKMGMKSYKKVADKATAKNVGRLSNRMENTFTNQNRADIQKALTDKGLSKREASLATAYITNSDKLTEQQVLDIENDEHLQSVIDEVLSDSGLDISDNSMKLAHARQGSTTPSTKASEASAQQVENTSVTENATSEENATESEFEASESGKTTQISTGKEVNVTEISSTKDGNIMLRLDNGEVVSSSDVIFGSEDEGLLYDNVADMGLNAATANAFIKGFDASEGISAEEYVLGFREAYRYGEYNFPVQEMSQDGFSARLSQSQKELAYNLGKTDAKYNVSEKQKTVESLPNKNPSRKGKVHFEGGTAVKVLTERQKASIKGLEKLSKILGVDFHIFESTLNANGKRYYRMPSGKITGANGWYDPKTGEIWIDLYAGQKGEGTILFTAAHELTHFIRQWSPAKFKVFADFLLERYGEKGVSVDELVQRQIEKAEQNNRKISYDEAYEEVVADSCEAMFADGDAIAKIAELKATDKSLWEKIKEFITELVAKIKKAYEGLSPDSVEASYVAEMLDSAEKLKAMWTDALADAGKAYSTLAEIDFDTESVAPMLSERTWTASEYVTEREETAKKISKALGVDIKTAYKYIDDINSVARLIADDRARLDYEPNLDEHATVLKPNSDYKYSVDMSTLCAKRLLFTGTFDAIQRALPNTVFDSEDIVALREMMQKRGYEVACGICYVESTRREIGRITQEFIDRYKEAQKTGKPITRINSEGKAVDLKKTKDQMETTADKSADKFYAEKGYTPTLADLNTTDIDIVKRDHPLVYEAYLNFMNARGQAKPKLLETRAEYKGEILKHFKYKSAVTARNNAGGLRLQSFSDFEVPHLIDMMQIVMDMSRVGLKSQAYTKVPAFAEIFGDTGVKINLSLIAKGDGLDANGNLVFDDVEGINHKEAFRLRDKYSKNVGTILVGKTDAHIIAAMADSHIDYIIPFHKSSWKESLYDALGLTGYADYTDYQNEKPIDKGREIKNFDPSEYWDFSKSGDENAQIYLAKCREDGRIPKFPQFQGYPGYWKLLIDFKMYDNDGVGSPQEVVRPTFNTEASEKILSEYKGGHRNFPVAKDVVEDFVKEHRDNDVLYSERMKKVDDAVDKAIKQKGNLGVKYNQERISEFPSDITAIVSSASEGKIDLSGKYVAISGNDIWHEYRSHSDSEKEAGRRQLPQTVESIKEAIMAIYSPDVVESLFTTNQNPTQRQSFAYAKKSPNGYYIVVEAVGGKKNPNVIPVMLLQFTEEKWNDMMSSGITLGELLFENDTEKRNSLDVELNKKNRVTVAQFASKEAIANTPRSPQFNNSIPQLTNSVNRDTEKNSLRNVEPIETADYVKMYHHFGSTKNYDVAGYILGNGMMLDFSGKHWGDTYSTSRQVDHRDIQETLGNRGSNNGVNAMIDMIGNGNIRLMPEVGGINLAVKPNSTQMSQLRGYINHFKGEVTIDIDEVGGDTIHSFNYTKGTSSAKVLADIKAYFDEGIVPQQKEEGETDIHQFLFSEREATPPKKTKKAYKLMRLVDGKLYPLFIGNNEEISVGTWYDADSPNLSQLKNLAPGTHLVDMKTGEAMTWDEYAEKHVPQKNGKPTRSKPSKDDVHWANDNGYRFMHIEEKAGGKSEGTMLKKYGDTRAYYNWGVNGSSKTESGEGSASLYALRPGWHFGEVPSMHQIGYDGEEGETVRLDNQVWVEVEMSADVDYNAEAEANWSGDIPTHIPTNGYYRFATNPTQKKTKGGNTANDATKADWFVAGAFKVNRILSDSEADSIVEKYNKANSKNVPLDYRRNYGRVFNAETMSIEDPIRYSDRVLMGSLFSGGGTLEAGLVYQMLDKEFAVEFNKKIAATYTDNHGKEHMFVGDVRDFNSKEKQNVFYLHASPVCKNFSPASHSGGETTLDITTAQATARVLEEQMPQVFTVENVKRYIGSEAYNIIINKLNKLGYTWDVAVYKASDYGNATKRERMIIRAVKDGQLPPKPQKASKFTSWGEATRDLWETDLIPSYLVQSKKEAIKNTPGLKGVNLTKLNRPLLIYDTTKSKTVSYAWADELAPTLTTKCGDARIIMPDGKVYAPTPKLMGRIQGLPDDYKYPKATTNAFKIIGNGIPTQLTKAVMGGVLDSAYEQTHDGQVLYSDRNTASFKGKPFWSGSVSLLDGVIEEVHSIEEAESVDFHHSMYFSQAQVEKMENGENAFFWVDNGIVQGDWRESVPKSILDKINGQIVTNVKYSDRSPSSVSTRSLLANALETTAQNDIERTKLEQYKSKIDLIESEYAKLAEIKKKANDIRFTKGRTAEETKRMKALDFEANQIANRINVYDRQLFNLESTTALKNVLQREKELARKKEAQKGKEALAKRREREAQTIRTLMDKNTESRKKAAEGRDKTAMRHKIRNIVDDLNKLLLNPTKDKHIPIGLQKPVASALAVINMDTVGAEERIAKYNELIAKAKDPDEIARLTKSRDNIELQGENLNEKLTILYNAYAALLKSDDPLVRNAHDEAIDNLIADTVDKVGDTSLRNMSLEQLEAVYDMFKAIKATIRNANKMFKEGKQETITANSEWAKREISAVGGHRDLVQKSTKWLNKFGWNMLKPIYAMKLIGSDVLTGLYENVRKGEDTWAVDVNEAKDFFKKTAKKYEYNTWDFKKQYKFTDSAGHSFSLSLEQIMSLYAYSKRKQADKHLELGGFIFDDSIEVTKKNKLGIPVTYEVNDANPYRLKKEDLARIISILDTDLNNVKGFVDEMQAYLSDVMGAKGNEVSLAMYDIKLYKEQNYFPLKTAKYFREFDPEKNGTPKIKNSGFSKNTVPQAGNPIVLSNFMDVWANHVNDMSMYHAFVLPLEDFMRVYNYSSTAGGYDSVQQYIKNAYGAQANQYIETLMNDLNGGARTDPATDLIGKGMSLFKKAAVFASASVVIQQPSAIARALAYIDAKYFVDKPEASKHSETWAEVKKYAPVAIIKEMGYFDTNMGRSTVDWIKEEKTWRDKVDDIASKAPALADELAWCAIWKAVKREIADSTNLTVGSEAFLKMAGKRFTEVVTKTQVYDSVLSRSALMRSKDSGAKMVTAFMAEPTTSLNMVVDAIIEGKRGNKKFAGKVVGAVAASIILNSILVSLVTAARDDDDDETYTEKYLESLTAELLDGFNPITYIPIFKDIWSIAQGYDVERSDMSIWSDFIQSIDNLFSDSKSGFEKTEGVVGAVASFFGLPAKNLMRDARAMYNLASTLLSGTPTTWAGVGEAVGGAVKDTIPFYTKIEKLIGADESKSDKLYDAIISGDQTHIDRVKAQYKDDKAIESAIRQGLRENDSRIHEAAQARYDGDIEEYKRIAKKIIAEGYFSQDTVVAAINAEINAIKKGETSEEETATDDTDKVNSIYKASDINDAFESGDTDMALEVIDDLFNTKVENYLADARKEAEKNGKTFNEKKARQEAESKAKSSIKSSMTSYWKPLYKEAYKSGNTAEKERIERILKASGLYGSASEVIKTCREWRTERD